MNTYHRRDVEQRTLQLRAHPVTGPHGAVVSLTVWAWQAQRVVAATGIAY
jgi:hypothetical protein